MSDTNSPQVQAEIDAFAAQHKALLAQMSVLETELQQLRAERTPTDPQRSRMVELNSQINSLAIQLNQLKVQESAVAAQINTPALVNAQTKKDLLQNILITTPLPPPGKVMIVHATIDNANLIDYMNITQHLNPYGRKRQCDTDLENLMAIINKDMNNSIAETLSIVKKLTKIVP
jgi:hypothetical protein